MNSDTLKNFYGFIIILFSLALYAQSITFNFTGDDKAVIVYNKSIQEGIKGIPEIFIQDRMYGLHDSLMRTPEYRPVPLAMFATEWQFCKDNPHYYHGMNVLLYAAICWLLFILLCKLLPNQNFLLPFTCTVLYVAHPIHTEVVDSIKSNDELLCFLFALLSILCLLKFIENKGTEGFLLLAALFYFLCIMSKETGIAYLLIVPLILYVFTDVKSKRIIIITSIYASVVLTFLFIRFKITEDIRYPGFNSPLMNSLWTAPDLLSQKATAFYVLLRYILLLFFPHPLTYDYTYAMVPIVKVTDPLALFSIIVYLLLGFFALISLLKMKREKNEMNDSFPNMSKIPDTQFREPNIQSLIAFAILFYLITIFPVSNILIMIGSPMAERFLFMPSLGFTIITAIFLIKITKSKYTNSDTRYPLSSARHAIPNYRYLLAVLIIVGLYSAKTIARSRYWKDNHLLYEHDVKTSDRSARAHYFCGNDLMLYYFPLEKDEKRKKEYIDKSIIEFKKTLECFPEYPFAHYCLGLAYMKSDDTPDAIANFEIALTKSTKPNYELFNNLGISYVNYGQYEKATNILDTAIRYFPKRKDAFCNIAWAYLKEQKNGEAIVFGNKAIEIDSNYSRAYMNAGCGYMNLNDNAHALEYLKKAVALDSLDPLTWFTLGTLFYRMGDKEKAKAIFNKAKAMKPEHD